MQYRQNSRSSMSFVQKLQLVCKRRSASSDGFSFDVAADVLLEVKC